MGLNKSIGNMYDFITHTWNTIKGACYHDCSYCYMKRWGKLNPVRFDEKELKTDLGKDNFIFVGSSCDMFAEDIPGEWIDKTLYHCRQYTDNRYLFQTKNPDKLYQWRCSLPEKSVICVTIESNVFNYSFMGETPFPEQRVTNLEMLKRYGLDTFITIEPIMDFNLETFVKILKIANPIQINIGADSGNNNLPEPPKEKILELITELEKFTKVKQKSNLKRLLK